MAVAVVLAISRIARDTAVVSSVAAEERGSAVGMLEMTRHLGHSLGVSLSSGVLESLVAGVAVSKLAGAYLRGFEQASLAMALLAGLAAAAIFWSERRRWRASLTER